MMNELWRATLIEHGKSLLNDTWAINLYIIKSNPDEVIDNDLVTSLLEKHLTLLEKDNMSSEFEYYKIGFAFLHFGNRGVDLTIWHIGRWGKTFETFICSWYCYERNIWQMEQLDAAEPMLCQYEMKLLLGEIAIITKLVSCDKREEIKKKYFEYSLLADIHS